MPEQPRSLESIVVPLEDGASSFCCYENPACGVAAGTFVPLSLLARIRDFAVARNLSITFVYGQQPAPASHEEIIASTVHTRIAPLALWGRYADAVYVINPDDVSLIDALESSGRGTFILRVAKHQLPALAAIAGKLLGRCRRLNLVLTDVGTYSNADLDEYASQLGKVKESFFAVAANGRAVEMNVLSDRLLLRSMNNCNAGIVHLTVGRDARLYLCPGFYYDNEDDSVGSLDDGVRIANRQLLDLENAPICSACDAYHCRRCFYQNVRLTLEINTPSRQQCVAAHVERNCSRLLLADLPRLTRDVTAFSPVPELSYVDPLEIVLRDGPRQAGKSAVPPAGQGAPTAE